MRLGELCAKGKSSLRQKDILNGGAYSVYGASGVVGSMATYQNEQPYVAVVKDGAGVGRAMLCDAETSVLGTMQALLPKEGCNSKYLLHLIRSLKLGEGFSGSTIPHIYYKNYSKAVVPFHDPDEQKVIANSLDLAEQIISQSHEVQTLLDNLVKSRFTEMFGDQKTNDLNLPLEKLGDTAFVGSSKRVFKDELVDKGVPFLRGTEVGAYGLGRKSEPSLFITRDHYAKLTEQTGKPALGDLLMPSICPDGQIWEVDTKKPFYFKDGRVLWVKPNREVLNSTFLRYAMKNRFESDFASIASGTTFAELKIVALKSMLITIPPLSLQREFAAFVAEVDKSRFITRQRTQSLIISLVEPYIGQVAKRVPA